MRPAVMFWITLAMAAGAAGCGSQTTVETVVSVTTVTATQAVPTGTSTTGGATPGGGQDASSGRDLAGRVVLIDPGHNGGNAAAPAQINRLVPSGRGLTKACDTTGTATDDERLSEASFNLMLAEALADLVRRRGGRVVLTRNGNSGVGPCINRRAAIGNRAGADVAVSLHADGGPPGGRGFHVIRPAPTSALVEPSIVEPSTRLARAVRAELGARGLRPADYVATDGLIARGDLGGLNLSRVPKVLVELGNMRNAEDARSLQSGAWRERAAAGLAAALGRFLRAERSP